ncbi:MAG: hypothetical protein AAB400_00660, partial [Patescibacteria group bacterium]
MTFKQLIASSLVSTFLMTGAPVFAQDATTSTAPSEQTTTAKPSAANREAKKAEMKAKQEALKADREAKKAEMKAKQEALK